MTERLVPPTIPEGAVYTSCWCEENIYLLGRRLMESRPDFITKWDAYVVFISNEDKTVRPLSSPSISRTSDKFPLGRHLPGERLYESRFHTRTLGCSMGLSCYSSRHLEIHSEGKLGVRL
jgi:N-terminal glutamine amidase